ncbi:hypothetical protein [Winogradskyella sp.]|uniref:hypothetical protein n=1 Tax=Winogradskyella sp. TaxID=1883156 RepID=UPI00261F71D0|nr:hypothetical protein [Winogradskyella sp.]
MTNLFKNLAPIFRIPLLLVATLLSILLTQVPVVPVLGTLLANFLWFTRFFWDFILPDWSIFDLHGRQLDILTFFSLLLVPTLFKLFNLSVRTWVTNHLIYPVLKIAGIDIKSLTNDFKIPYALTAVFVVGLVWYMTIQEFTIYGIFKPILAFVLLFFLVGSLSSFSDEDMEGGCFLRVIGMLIVLGLIFKTGLMLEIFAVPGSMILETFDLGYKPKYFGDDFHSFGYVFWSIIFLIIFIITTVAAVKYASEEIFLGIVVALLILLANIILCEFTDCNNFLSDYIYEIESKRIN